PIAVWQGKVRRDRRALSRRARRSPRRECVWKVPTRRASDFHDFRFFRLEQRLQLCHVLVVGLLQILFRRLYFVLGDLVQLLELFAAVGACVPNTDATVLGELVHDLDELLATLLVHGRQRHADDAALRARIEAEVGLADRLLDRLELTLVVRSDQERPRVGRCDTCDLIELHLLSVDVDANTVEHVRRRLAGPDRAELALGVLDRLVHGSTGVLHNLRNRRHDTRVPTGSPRTAFMTAPGWLMFRTMSGKLFSLHNVTAVWSMTPSSRCITSLYEIVSYRIAFGSRLGSAEYTPSTLVALMMTSARI